MTDQSIYLVRHGETAFNADRRHVAPVEQLRGGLLGVDGVDVAAG